MMFNIDKCIQIVQEEREKYGLLRGAHSNNDHCRCLIGLLLSHYGWDGKGFPFGQPRVEGGILAPLSAPWDKVHEELGDWYEDRPPVSLAALSDRCNNWDEVIVELKALKTKYA